LGDGGDTVNLVLDDLFLGKLLCVLCGLFICLEENDTGIKLDSHVNELGDSAIVLLLSLCAGGTVFTLEPSLLFSARGTIDIV
jgi:hypothetical protein